MSTRQDIVDCLTTLGELVSPSLNRPATLGARMAWPRVASYEAAEAGWSYEATWQVQVVIPGDGPTAQDTWFEDNAVDIAQALRPALLVESIERTTDGGLPVAVFTGRSE